MMEQDGRPSQRCSSSDYSTVPTCIILSLHFSLSQLSCSKICTVTSVCNMMGVVDRVYQFFAAHPKRQRALGDAILSTQPDSAIFKVKGLCRTRWVQ